MHKWKWIGIVLVVMAAIAPASGGRSFVVSPNGNDANAGTVAQPWRTIAKANASLTAGDTVFIRAGTYGDAVSPANSGAAQNPLVYMNYQSEVCSLFVSARAINLTDRNYVVVQGLHMQMAESANDYVMAITGGGNNVIVNCMLYGGSTHNVSGWGSWPAFLLSNTNNNLVIRNYLDRQDHDITDDAYRGDGLGVHGTSMYNIIEGNTVVNVSHFGIAVPYGVRGESYNIVRNNRVHNCHVGLGNTDQTSRCLYEGNVVWSPGQVNTYRGGVSCEFSPEKCIIRYNAFYLDSISAGSLRANTTTANGFVTNTATSTPIDNRVYHNTFMGQSLSGVDQCSLLLQNDNPGVWDFGRNSFVNNIIAYPGNTTGSYPISWQDRGKTLETVTDQFRGNLLWRGSPGAILANWGVSGGTDNKFTMVQLQSRMPAVWDNSNFEASPLWVDSTSTMENRRFQLAPASPCIDRGVSLTTTRQGSSNTTAIYVTDASYFHYAWSGTDYDRGDSVYIDGVRAELQNIDYTNNILYTTSNVTVANGAGVYLLASYYTAGGYQSRLKGSAPDVGAFESDGAASVTQAPAAPALQSPANAATGIDTTVQLQWTASPGATSNQVQVSTSSGFLTTLVNQSGISGASYTVSSLAPGTAYFWRVRAANGAGQGSWSAVRQFTTRAAVSVPAAPALQTPADAATGIDTTVQLQWTASPGATSNQVQVAASSAFLATIRDQSGITGTAYALTSLSFSTTYFWRVRAVNGAGQGSWSAVRQFTTRAAVSTPVTQPPAAPVLQSPADNMSDVDVNLQLQWTASPTAVSNQVQVSTISTFITTILDQSGVTGTVDSLTSLSFSTTFFWRVRATNAAGTGSWSSVRSFTTRSPGSAPVGQVPAALTLLSPANDTTGVDITVQLQWAASVTGTVNQVQVDTVSLFAEPIVDKDSVAGTKYALSALAFNTTYFWRSRALNAAGPGLWSAVRQFTTKGAVSAMTELASLEQNYPNPFNPSTALRYSLLAASHVSLKVYNLLGRLVATLEDGDRSAGRHEVRFDASGLASGVYFYTLQAGGMVQTKRMILVR